jgi:hypothetical protein
LAHSSGAAPESIDQPIWVPVSSSHRPRRQLHLASPEPGPGSAAETVATHELLIVTLFKLKQLVNTFITFLRQAFARLSIFSV